MATFVKCDGCDIVSPDETGLHIANEWAKVTVQYSKFLFGKIDREYNVCPKCLKMAKSALPNHSEV